MEPSRHRPLLYIDFLKARIIQLEAMLVAKDIEPVPEVFTVVGLTRHEITIIEILLHAYPKSVNVYAIEEGLPKKDHVKERDIRIVNVYISKIRRKLGRDIIICTKEQNYRINISREEVVRRSLERFEKN
jgi:DNA-binding response OmpR family regulator